jgi:hypothetical protein
VSLFGSQNRRIACACCSRGIGVITDSTLGDKYPPVVSFTPTSNPDRGLVMLCATCTRQAVSGFAANYRAKVLAEKKQPPPKPQPPRPPNRPA